jgi:hypothetical protein
MECPRFKLYNSLLLLRRVGEITAFQVVKKHETEESLRHALRVDPNDIYVLKVDPNDIHITVAGGGGRSSGKATTISRSAANMIQLSSGSCTMVPSAAARIPLAASIPPLSQSNKRSSVSTTRPRPPSHTPWAVNHSNATSPVAVTSLGSIKKKARLSTPLRTASITPNSMASSSKSTIGVSDYEEPRFEDKCEICNSIPEPSSDDREPSFDDSLRAAIRNSLQKEPTFDDTLQTAIRNSLQEPSLLDDDLQTAIRNSLQEPNFADDLQAAIRNSL